MKKFVKPSKEVGKKPMKKRSAGWTAKTRVRPNESPLWAHLELIRTMRMGHHTWAEIAQAIQQAGGPKVSFTTVYNFYKRAAERAKKGKPRPFGFEDPFAGTTPVTSPPGSEQPDPPPAPPKTNPPAASPASPDNPTATLKERYAKNQAEFLKKKAAQIQNEQRIYIHKPGED